MSQYPYGNQSQGQPHYPPYQPYSAYSTPNGYAAQPTQQYSQQQPPQSTTENYYVASQSAYNHNANSIPGLGTPSTVSAFAAPFNEQWAQSYGASAPSAQHSAYSLPVSAPPIGPTSSDHHIQTFNLPGLAPKAGSTWSLPDVKSKEASKGTTHEQSREVLNSAGSEEEGEVSEPDFDDLYDDLSNPATVAPQPSVTPAKITEDLVTSNSDQEPDFYNIGGDGNASSKLHVSPIGEFAPQSITEISDEAERDRSRSYSPYLSPREIEQDTVAASNSSIAETQNALSSAESGSLRTNNKAVASKVPSETLDRVKDPNSLFGINGTAEDQATLSDQEKASAAALNESAVEANGFKVYSNLPEAQNEAKKAILRLLPHGVKFQTYIDEGFDATVVKELFSQLHLPTDLTVTVPPEKPANSQQKENPRLSSEALPAAQVDSMTKKQEERKDKIARLLAEKKAKAAVAASNAGPTAEPKSAKSNISHVSTTPTKPLKTRAEMDRLLQQKMQALRQKAAQKPSTPQTPTLVLGDKPATPPIATTPALAGPRPDSTASTPVSVNAVAAPVQGTAAPSSGTAAEPSSTLSSVRPPLPPAPKAAQVANQRKRPVAADFMDYPIDSIKRPSLANRQNSSLVISLSDDEDDEDDDDDDVEMEVDSAEDSPAPAHQSLTLPRRGPLIRDYPPLTNRHSPRHLASPASGASSVGGRTATVDLQARERQIEELKRRIQEAEARAKNKSKKGSATPQTPSAGNITPTEQSAKPPTRRVMSSSDADEKGGPSAQLLQEAEAANIRQASQPSIPQQAESEPHSRVSSVQLPGKSDRVREKAERLRKMQEEMMKLKAEIDEDLAQEEDLDDDIGHTKRDSDDMPQSVEAPEGSDASKSSDMIPELHNTAQQFGDALPASIAEVEAPDDQEENMDISSNMSDEESAPSSPMPPPQPASLSPQSAQQEHITSDVEAQQTEATDLAVHSPYEAGAIDTNVSDDYEPPDAQVDDQVAVGSPPFSPAPVDHTDSNASNQRQTNTELQKRLAELRNQLISAKASKEQLASSQPMTVEETNGEVQHVSSVPVGALLTQSKAIENTSPMSTTSFVPYDSPLRYFRAYRFHPRYSDDVASGLKSLTYSNRIDPKKEMCPDELDGTECPRGNACQFQHFKSIVAPDNEIILDLGSSEDLTGDQKKNFNNGLRELVATFQQSKVRDFSTIAQAIVEFRRQFLGDTSKILRLEGVNI